MTGERQMLSQANQVVREQDRVYRPRRIESQNRRDFLRHLESAGLPVEHLIELEPEREVYAFAPGEMIHPQKWSDEALFEVGRMTRALHGAGAAFHPEHPEQYKAWCLREIGGEKRIWCHGDIAPWNLIVRQGMPACLVDWEYAGPLDPMVELARICWLFPQLVDDDLQKIYDLPSPEKRAAQVRLICEGYQLARADRQRLISQMIEVIICETAHEAIDVNLTFEDSGSLWGFAWRTRSLYWVWRNRALLEKAMN
jgi:Ser/Thr protein kinase RdoA (MazF antagonist)